MHNGVLLHQAMEEVIDFTATGEGAGFAGLKVPNQTLSVWLSAPFKPGVKKSWTAVVFITSLNEKIEFEKNPPR